MDDHWRADREVQGEPRLHAWSMLRGIYAVEDILVKFSGEIACEAVDLGLGFLNCEGQATVLSERLIGTLREILELLLVRVGQVAEGEDILRSGSTGISGTIDLDNVWKLIWVLLLLKADST